ncbi:MAG TPA: hypothetical protein VK932_24295 [Kofleriaceae bacterium]|nr:hypothetical protein [Kofleriaceae bacterium]
MSEDNLTVHILRELREEIHSVRSTTQRLDQRLDQHVESTNQRFDAMDRRFDRLESELRAEILASEVRVATRITEQAAATRDLHDLLNANLSLRDRVERCEHDIADLKGRVH